MSTQDELKGAARELAGDVLVMLEEEAQSIAGEVGTDLRAFLAEYAAEIAKQAWIARTGDEQAKADARDNIDRYTRAAESRLAAAALQVSDAAQATLMRILRTVGKAILSTALALV